MKGTGRDTDVPLITSTPKIPPRKPPRETDEQMIHSYEAARKLQELRESITHEYETALAAERESADAERARFRVRERRLWTAIAVLGTICFALGIAVGALVFQVRNNEDRIERIELFTREAVMAATVEASVEREKAERTKREREKREQEELDRALEGTPEEKPRR